MKIRVSAVQFCPWAPLPPKSFDFKVEYGRYVAIFAPPVGLFIFGLDRMQNGYWFGFWICVLAGPLAVGLIYIFVKKKFWRWLSEALMAVA